MNEVNLILHFVSETTHTGTGISIIKPVQGISDAVVSNLTSFFTLPAKNVREVVVSAPFLFIHELSNQSINHSIQVAI